MKTCSHCKTEKPLTEFYSNKSKKNGFSSWCKPCDLEKQKKWQAANPENRRAANRSWAERNREVNRKSAAKYYKENKTELLAYHAARHKKTYTKEKGQAHHKGSYARLIDSVVCKALGALVCDVPKELIEAKRLQLQIVRKLKELKK